jgi:glycosyltransferase involved in cell wall biosynthesis
VVFPGNLKQEALQQLYAHAAVVISPLTGRALSEAAFGSAPIVAYDLDWQSDLIESGVTGELVPFRDAAAMAAAALKLLDDGDYAHAMGEAVRARAMDMLHPTRLNEHERAEYAKLLRSCG